MTRTMKRTAPARPAPFTEEQVAALNAGEANLGVVMKLLKAHRQPRLPLEHKKVVKQAPVPLTEAELRQLATGRGTPANVADALERSATSSANRRAKAKESQRPERNPPDYE